MKIVALLIFFSTPVVMGVRYLFVSRKSRWTAILYLSYVGLTLFLSQLLFLAGQRLSGR